MDRSVVLLYVTRRLSRLGSISRTVHYTATPVWCWRLFWTGMWHLQVDISGRAPQ
jgi:hypothetical protein